MNNLKDLSDRIRNPYDGMLVFLEKVCGLPVSRHEGQKTWLLEAYRRINILRPGNRFGKSLIGAGKHLYHHFTKINIQGMYKTVEEWQRIKYDTLNFGPGYEQAREILRLARDIAQGNIFIPEEFQAEYGATNQSLLKDWFIVDDKAEAQALPYIEFAPGGSLFGRSYSDMGAAFKMKGIAFVTGDEVADIPELWSFTNGTLLPRLAQYKNASIDYYGTPQSEGHDYMRMIEMAEQDMARPEWERTGMFYVQKGKMTQNPFLDRDTVASIQSISDPIMRKQIIDGEYVETGDKYFGYERIQHAIRDVPQQEKGIPGHRYVLSCDFAGGESYWSDFTVMMVFDYTEEPYKLVKFIRFKGGSIPIPSQYKMVEDIFMAFKEGGTGANVASVKLVIDGSALGGKNAVAFLKHLQPIIFETSGKLKAEMLATTKIAFDGGQTEKFRRKIKILDDGTQIEENENWGLVKIPPFHALVNELQNYKLDDSKIRTDCVMTLGMAVHYLEMRRPRTVKNRMVNFDLLALG